MGKRPIFERIVGGNECINDKDIKQNHKQRQFKGHLWIDDYHSRKQRSWLISNMSGFYGVEMDREKLLKVLRKMTMQKKEEKNV